MTDVRQTKFDGLSTCRCGDRPEFRDVLSLAFTVYCDTCRRQTGLQRCAQDAWDAWERMMAR